MMSKSVGMLQLLPQQHDNSNDPSHPSTTHIPLYINGQDVTASKHLLITSPLTAQTLWTYSSAAHSDLDHAITSASTAFKTWRHTSPATVQDHLLRAADLLSSRQSTLSAITHQETGAAQSWCDFDVSTAVAILRDVASRAAHIHGTIPKTADPSRRAALVLREPYGVVLGIAPWNAPWILGIRAVVYAVVAGNAVVLKGSERCPRTFWEMVKVFGEAGVPAGVVNLVFVGGEDAGSVVEGAIAHPEVRKVNFTGSTAVGAKVAEVAGRALKPVLMELGGKASAVICEDADLELAAKECALGAFLNAGQICMSTEKLVVHRSVAKEFAPMLKKELDGVYSPKGEAPVLVSEAAVDKVKRLIEDAKAKGAEALGDSITPVANGVTDVGKFQLRPTVLTGVKKGMDVYRDESFGPLVSLIEVGSDEEAIALANDTDFGLSGAVFTKDLGRGLSLAKAIDSGAVHINGMTVHDEPMLPHGGVKQSGWGRFNAQWGIEEFLKLKTITYNI